MSWLWFTAQSHGTIQTNIKVQVQCDISSSRSKTITTINWVFVERVTIGSVVCLWESCWAYVGYHDTNQFHASISGPISSHAKQFCTSWSNEPLMFRRLTLLLVLYNMMIPFSFCSAQPLYLLDTISGGRGIVDRFLGPLVAFRSGKCCYTRKSNVVRLGKIFRI